MIVPFQVISLAAVLGIAHASVYTVTVGIDETNGQPGLGFDPSVIHPAAGDTITFTFQLPDYLKNPASTQHSATQSTFSTPCTPLGGFDTGVQSTGSANANTGASYNLVVNDTQPLWFFSSANNDCKSGMVLAVNPPTTGDMTPAAFKQNAMSSSGGSAISSPAPSTSGSSSQASGSIASLSQTGASRSTAPAPAPSPSSSSSSHTGGALSNTATVELAFAGIVALVGVLMAM